MYCIYKYELPVNGTSLIALNDITQVLDIQLQRGTPVLWARVNTEGNPVTKQIIAVNTGEDISAYTNADTKYLGTIQITPDYVKHYYMVME